MKSIKRLSLIALTALLITQHALATQPYRKNFVEKLYIEVGGYQCPEKNKYLHDQLGKLLKDKHLLAAICNKNPSPNECNVGAFSLTNETSGLANLVSHYNPKECSIAHETKTQLHWLLGFYLR